ncbi:MAG: hypothetical protein ABSF53_17555 [Terracidiphilus sp.]
MHLFRSARLLLLALLVCAIPASSYAGVFVSINFGPPVLPVYVQPVCPEPNLIWTPGYWAYGDEGYFWVPGAWVPAPFVGGLWTPSYWGWSGGLYVFHPGYWGYHVGYYGGVNYGFGYGGIGFAGGEWRGGAFAYNTAVVNVNTTIIHTTYVNRTIVEQNTIANPNHVAYSGGPGGIQHAPTAQEQIAEHETHTPPTSFQTQHIQSAQMNHQSYAKVNGGRPATLAVAKPLAMESHPAPPAGGRPAFSNAPSSNRPAFANAPANNPARLPPSSAGHPGGNSQPNGNPPRNMESHPNNAPHNPPPPKSNPKPSGEKPKEGHEK